MEERYIGKPQHLLWAVLFLALGAVTFPLGSSWAWFGISTMLLGTATWMWIVFSGMWHSYEAYWKQIADVAAVLNKTTNPDVWAAFGFKKPPQAFKVQTDEREHGYGVTQTFDLPGSIPQFQTFVDGVLLGRSLSETEWVVSSKTYSAPTFRKLKQILEQRKLITVKNIKSPKQGYTYTRKGKDFFLLYASEGTKLMLLDRKDLHAPSPSPMLLSGE